MIVHLRTRAESLNSCGTKAGTVTALTRKATCPACIAAHTPEREADRLVAVQQRETELVKFCRALAGQA